MRTKNIRERVRKKLVDVAIIFRNFCYVQLPLFWMRLRLPLVSATENTFLILPCDPDYPHGSFGDVAMLMGLMQSIARMYPNARFTIVGRRMAQLTFPSIGVVDVVNAWDSVRNFDRLTRRHKALFALGADVMDGAYGAAMVCRAVTYCNHAARRGIPATILGFSFSRTPRFPTVHVLSRMHPGVRLNVRDAFSLERFTAATHTPARLAADVAFLMAPATALSGDVLSWVEDMRRQGKMVVGVNLSTHALASIVAMRGACYLVKSVAEQLKLAGNRLPLAYVLIPHDVKPLAGDVKLLKDLDVALRDTGFPFVQYSIQEDPASVKLLVSRLDLVLTSRMHLAISSLGVGTPTLCIVYKDKFEGLYAHFDLPPDTLIQGATIRIETLAEQLMQAIAGRAAARTRILEKRPAVLELAQRNLDALVS